MSDYVEIEELDKEEQREEEERRRKRRERLLRMEKEKKRQLRRRKMVMVFVPVLFALVVLIIVFVKFGMPYIREQESSNETINQDFAVEENQIADEHEPVPDVPVKEEVEVEPEYLAGDNVQYSATKSDQISGFQEEVESTYGIVVDLQTNQIVAAREAFTRMNPASMTKILTVLVAAEHITEEQLDDTFEITPEINNYVYVNDLSAVNFSNNEKVTVRDLFYGTILQSGGDAAIGLATYIAGSQEAFVELMNQKLGEMGLTSSHFTNCVGMYDENHYSTMYDMAMMLEAAIDNEWCREVLSTHTYTTNGTDEHPEGITVSNWFLRRIEDHISSGEVLCAKTGFVVQSRNCAASYGVDSLGNGYIVVTGDAHSGWRCIFDHVELYKRFFAKTEVSESETSSQE